VPAGLNGIVLDLSCVLCILDGRCPDEGCLYVKLVMLCRKTDNSPWTVVSTVHLHFPLQPVPAYCPYSQAKLPLHRTRLRLCIVRAVCPFPLQSSLRCVLQQLSARPWAYRYPGRRSEERTRLVSFLCVRESAMGFQTSTSTRGQSHSKSQGCKPSSRCLISMKSDVKETADRKLERKGVLMRFCVR
jgi:hypothetical protein